MTKREAVFKILYDEQGKAKPRAMGVKELIKEAVERGYLEETTENFAVNVHAALARAIKTKYVYKGFILAKKAHGFGSVRPNVRFFLKKV